MTEILMISVIGPEEDDKRPPLTETAGVDDDGGQDPPEFTRPDDLDEAFPD